MRSLMDSKAKPRARSAPKGGGKGLAAGKSEKAPPGVEKNGRARRHVAGSAKSAKIALSRAGASTAVSKRSAAKKKAADVPSKLTRKTAARPSAPVREKSKKSAAQVATKAKLKANGKKPAPQKIAAKPKSQAQRAARAPVAVTRESNGAGHVPAAKRNGRHKKAVEVAIIKSEIVRPRTVRVSFLAAASNAESKMDAKRSEIVLAPTYRPSDGEPFMNERQRIYFRNKLVNWKEDIVRQNMETLKGLHEDSPQQADPADRATAETDRALELRARDRQRKLMGKIESALARIEEGSYGYCEETGEPISLKRLDARPIATLSLEAQERRERRERIFRED